ncbi:MAG: HD domain-containing protein [Clostridiales bacterium]|nr:HD domain-containing protein [Clostridiales bacterium]
MSLIDDIFKKMTEYEDSPKRINHFLKVWGYASFIGRSEGLSEREQLILEAAALTHDIGIKPSLVKYNSSAGKYQEAEGSIEAEKLLSELTEDGELIERLCYLIGHHHTYGNIEGADYQILVEADFLVNAYEDNLSREAIEAFGRKIFKTAESKRILRETYLRKR